MKNKVEFKDFSLKVNELIEEKAIQFLHEASGELVAKAADNSRHDTGQLMQSWDYQIDKSKLQSQVGSPLENAIWEEFGTGEYAVEGKGRKGYWVYVKGSSSSSSSTSYSTKSYTLKQAKQIMRILREQGLEAYYTKGKKPNHTLEKSFKANKNKIIARANQIFKEIK